MPEKARCLANMKIETPHAKALENALEPDNRMTPPGMKIECKGENNTLECTVEVECENPAKILTLRNTLEDMLTAIKAIIETLEKTA